MNRFYCENQGCDDWLILDRAGETATSQEVVVQICGDKAMDVVYKICDRLNSGSEQPEKYQEGTAWMILLAE